MKLSKYPAAIASHQQKLLEANKMLECLLSDLEAKEAEIESAIAFDVELKNDAQRRARKLELIHSITYQSLKSLVHNQRITRDTIQIELTQLLNEFSVSKLEVREKIANLETLTV